MKKIKEYLNLYFSFFKIGLITFGGGLALVSMFYDEFVERKKYLDNEEFLNIVAIAESTPGPIAINTATYIGYKRYKLIGSIVATLGVVTPSIIVISFITYFYDKFIEIEIIQNALKGIMSGVVVLIGFAIYKLSKNIKENGILLVSLISILLTILLRLIFNINSILIIIGGGLIGYILYSLILNKKGINK